MAVYNVNGKEVNLPDHFESKSTADQNAYIDNLITTYTDEEGNFNPPANLNLSPHEHAIQGAELGALTKGIQDIGIGIKHKATDLLNRFAPANANAVPGSAAIKDPLAGTPLWQASRSDILNAEMEMKRIHDLYNSMPKAEQAKWEFSIEKPELVPKGTNAKVLAERAAKAAEEAAAKAEAKQKAARTVMGKMSNVPGVSKVLPYASRALSGAQILQGMERLNQPGWRNKVSGGMNIVGGALPIASEFFPPLEGIALPASIGLGVGSEFVAPSKEEIAPTIEVRPTKKKAGGLAQLKK